MKLSQPVGNTLYGPLLLRMSLGAYFAMAGFAKIRDIGGFVEQVQSFNLLPPQFSTVYGIVVPYLEIFAGVLLVFGMWTTLGAIILAVILATFIYAFGLFPNTNLVFNKDIILFSGALSVMYSGSGAFSVDRFRTTGS